VRFNKHYGEQREYWQGVDVSTSFRLGGGALVQGGISWGQQVIDNCEILAKVPEAGTPTVSLTGATGNIGGPLGVPFCHQAQPFLMQIKGLGTYTIPRIDVQLSGTFQSVPGPQLSATYTVPQAEVIGLGRNLSGGNTVDVNIIEPGTLYGDRLFQTDFRVGKVFRFAGNRRATVGVDLFNLFNANSVLTQQSTYSVTNTTLWGTPQAVQQARLMKFSLSLSY
jgi:hypothetical protein